MPVGRSSERRIRQHVARPRTHRKPGQQQARSRPMLDKKQVLRLAARLVKPAAVVGALILLVVGYRTLASSSLFEMQRIDIDNASPALQAQVAQTVRNFVGETKVMSIDLDQVKREVEQLKMVRSATVARSLPNALYLNIEERKPILPVKRDAQTTVWIDEDGVILGEVADPQLRKVALTAESGRTLPPFARGFYEDPRTPAMVHEDRERISIYTRLARELGEEGAKLWNLIQEIDLTYLKSINLRLINPPVTIVVGNTDYRNRLETALQVLRAIENGDVEALQNLNVQNPQSLIENADNIHVIHAERSDHIVLTFSAPGKRQARNLEPKPATSTLIPNRTRREGLTGVATNQNKNVGQKPKPVSAPKMKAQRQEAKPKTPPGKDKSVRSKPNKR